MSSLSAINGVSNPNLLLQSRVSPTLHLQISLLLISPRQICKFPKTSYICHFLPSKLILFPPKSALETLEFVSVRALEGGGDEATTRVDRD
ncbi:hypothetical protein MRB53_010090 [Persea americana]|uniref:Uncharacterized protein n=1 Tax=Persea americana TaxID=3435 RepID=A0ACC2LRL9_PERAE|nr:hypothetical protein MRB53_010090 [Persea americana]